MSASSRLARVPSALYFSDPRVPKRTGARQVVYRRFMRSRMFGGVSSDREVREAKHVLDFWGKARSIDPTSVEYHPVAYHSLDVAACVRQILQARPLALARGASLLGLDVNQTPALDCCSPAPRYTRRAS